MLKFLYAVVILLSCWGVEALAAKVAVRWMFWSAHPPQSMAASNALVTEDFGVDFSRPDSPRVTDPSKLVSLRRGRVPQGPISYLLVRNPDLEMPKRSYSPIWTLDEVEGSYQHSQINKTNRCAAAIASWILGPIVGGVLVDADLVLARAADPILSNWVNTSSPLFTNVGFSYEVARFALGVCVPYLLVRYSATRPGGDLNSPEQYAEIARILELSCENRFQSSQMYSHGVLVITPRSDEADWQLLPELDRFFSDVVF